MYAEDKEVIYKVARFQKTEPVYKALLYLQHTFSTGKVARIALKIAAIDPQRNFASDYVGLEILWHSLQEMPIFK